MFSPVVASPITPELAARLLADFVNQRKLGCASTLDVRPKLALRPFYLFTVIVTIRRGFGLKPRLLTFYLWVNALTGQVLRTADLPELINATYIVDESNAPSLNKKEAETVAHYTALQHTLRFYRSFWTPEVTTKECRAVQLPYWLAEINFPNGAVLLELNAFSGEIHRGQEQDRGVQTTEAKMR
ncbi:hypothetical protein [Gelria sp. Kuro-4]|uniref:hypothetical protein n=1 Tax=Gelria sp. Kuro-4 TaxID=2796927 RepID=UPI001BED5CD5|nr:hypothetical protein [Gelria sp. Kuro-4]BCV24120.1 hypothetical protein kuro4_08930 [Gelria sp. Kuro-4]